MATKFIPVKDDDQIETLASLADVIWHEYWPDIISKEQTDYMVEKYQSVEAITDQINNQSYEYFFINNGETNVGFFGLQPDPENEKLFLSKLYVAKNYRGQGFASDAFTFLENFCQERGLDAIWLTVNKNNRKAIDVYKIKGFETVRKQTKDIGEGFCMDDYIMEKHLL